MDERAAALVAKFQNRSQQTLQKHKDRASKQLSSIVSIGSRTSSLFAAKHNGLCAQHKEMSAGIHAKHLELADRRLAELQKINAQNGIIANLSLREEKRDMDPRPVQPRKKTIESMRRSSYQEEGVGEDEEKTESASDLRQQLEQLQRLQAEEKRKRKAEKKRKQKEQMALMERELEREMERNRCAILEEKLLQKKREKRERRKRIKEQKKRELAVKERMEKASRRMNESLKREAKEKLMNTRTVYRQQRAPASAPSLPPPPLPGTIPQQRQQQESMNMMQVVIPNGVGPGQQMRVALPNGQQCAVVVPQGYRAGMALTIQVPVF